MAEKSLVYVLISCIRPISDTSDNNNNNNNKNKLLTIVMTMTATTPSSTDHSITITKWHPCVPYLIYGILGPCESVPQTASRSIQPFWQGSSFYQPQILMLYNAFQWSTPPWHGEMWTQSNTWLLWPTQVHIQNCFTISSAILQGSAVWPTHIQTQRPCYIDIWSNSPHVQVPMMHANNTKCLTTQSLIYVIQRHVTVTMKH